MLLLSSMNKINLQIKKNNILKIFNIIQEFEPLSRRDVERISGLSWGTVSSVCTDLIKVGYINTYKETVAQMGRTPDRLVVNRADNLVLGIDINIIGLSFVVSDLAGNIIDSCFEKLISIEKNLIIEQVVSKIETLFKTYKKFLNINISMQGQVDSEKGISLFVEQFSNWNNINITQIISERFQTPTYLYHDPDCLMYYNLVKRKNKFSKLDNVILLKMDESIGMSLLLSGEIYKEETEIAHICVETNGRSCKCGKQGCLDTYSSLGGLTSIYNDKFGRKLQPVEFITLLDVKNKDAVNLLEDGIRYLGIALSNLINILNIKTVCLEGLMMKYSSYLINNLRNILLENVKFDVSIIVNDYLLESPALGASLKTINQNLEKIIFSKKELLDAEGKN